MPTMNAAEKMLNGKLRLVKRLKADIHAAERGAAQEIERINGRIRLAQVIIDALQKGTLKP